MNKIVSSFAEFWQAIKSIRYDSDEVLLFRGHPDKTYFLQPGAFREKEKDAEMNQYHKIMVEYPEEFKTRAHLSNLVKMQHYGTSTRLLDFSYNPLVALFFASEKYSQGNKDGQVIVAKVKRFDILHHNSDKALMLSCIPCFSDKDQEDMKKFCLDHRGRITEQNVRSYDNPMHRFLHEIRGEYPGFECEMIGEDLLNGYFVSPFKDNERMKLQSGLFYLFGLDTKPIDNNSRFKFERIDIRLDAKDEILKDLELLNISNAHLYSGLERAAMNIRDKRCEWNKK